MTVLFIASWNTVNVADIVTYIQGMSSACVTFYLMVTVYSVIDIAISLMCKSIVVASIATSTIPSVIDVNIGIALVLISLKFQEKIPVWF